jgi:hypothetical protein
MIVQAVLDFIRDFVVAWLYGINGMLSGFNAAEAGDAIGGVAASGGRVIALFISPGVWGPITVAWGLFLTVYFATALIAIVARRGAGGGSAGK